MRLCNIEMIKKRFELRKILSLRVQKLHNRVL